MAMGRRAWIIVVMVVLAAGASGAWFYAQSRGSTPRFRTVKLERGPLTATVSATGTLNAVVTVQVGSQVSGQIKELFADFNSQVKRNQLVARIDPEKFQAAVSQAKAQVDAAKANVLNQRALVEKTRADLANTQAALAVAKAQTAKAQVAVLDSRRTLARNADLRKRGLIAQADEDTAQAAYDSAVAQAESAKAQEVAQASQIRSAEAQLKVTEAMLQAASANVVQQEGGREPPGAHALHHRAGPDPDAGGYQRGRGRRRPHPGRSTRHLHRGLLRQPDLLGRGHAGPQGAPGTPERRHLQRRHLRAESGSQAPARHDGQRAPHRGPEGLRSEGAELRAAIPPARRRQRARARRGPGRGSGRRGEPTLDRSDTRASHQVPGPHSRAAAEARADPPRHTREDSRAGRTGRQRQRAPDREPADSRGLPRADPGHPDARATYQV